MFVGGCGHRASGAGAPVYEGVRMPWELDYLGYTKGVLSIDLKLDGCEGSCRLERYAVNPLNGITNMV